MVFISVVRTRHVVEQLCELQLTPGALQMHQHVPGLGPLDPHAASATETVHETDIFKFIDFADFGFLTSLFFSTLSTPLSSQPLSNIVSLLLIIVMIAVHL